MRKIENNPKLARHLANPRMAEALHKFQTDQVTAMKQYQSDAEVQEFFHEFCSVMGDHFTKLADTTKPKPKGTEFITKFFLLWMFSSSLCLHRGQKSRGVIIKWRYTVSSGWQLCTKFYLFVEKRSEEGTQVSSIVLLIVNSTYLYDCNRLLSKATPEFRQKVNLLVSKGILAVQ